MTTPTTALEIIQDDDISSRVYRALGGKIGLKEFQEGMGTALRQNEKLRQCTPGSFGACYIQAAQIGLIPNTPLKHAWLIPRKNRDVLECTLMMGYQGMIELALRSGYVVGMNAQVVRTNDKFECNLTANPPIKHTPSLEGGGELVGAYAVLYMREGPPIPKYLPKIEVLAARPPYWRTSPGWGSNNPFAVAEMWQKTAIRRVMKLAPMDESAALALEHEEQEVRGVRAFLDPVTGKLTLTEPVQRVQEIEFTEQKPPAADARPANERRGAAISPPEAQSTPEPAAVAAPRKMADVKSEFWEIAKGMGVSEESFLGQWREDRPDLMGAWLGLAPEEVEHILGTTKGGK